MRIANVVVLALFLLLVAVAVQGYLRSGEWEGRATSALALADSLGREADRLKAVADSIRDVNDEVVPQIIVSHKTTLNFIDSVRAIPVPDTCIIFTAPRDEAIDSLVVVAEGWRDAYSREHAATALLDASVLRLRQSNDSLFAVLSDRPTSRRWLPDIGAGVMVGMCLSGPCVGLGVTIAVKIF